MSLGGYANRVAHVDLRTAQVAYKPIPEEWARKYIGARGLGVRYVRANGPTVEPLAPENMLCFLNGPLTGTVTDTHHGGWSAARLRWSGFDGLIFSGKSDQPVYLYVEDGKAELRDASDLWGQGVHATIKELQQRHGEKDLSVIAIGPAGERLVRFGAWLNENDRASGRGGTGAVGGSKNLKAVVIKSSRHYPQPTDKPAFDIARRQAFKRESVEYEPAWSVGANRGMDDINTVAKIIDQANDLGYDAIEVGHCLSVLMEATEQGYVPAADGLAWGDGAAMVALAEKIGRREGIGDRLAEGPARFAAQLGHPELSMTVSRAARRQDEQSRRLPPARVHARQRTGTASWQD